MLESALTISGCAWSFSWETWSSCFLSMWSTGPRVVWNRVNAMVNGLARAFGRLLLSVHSFELKVLMFWLAIKEGRLAVAALLNAR